MDRHVRFLLAFLLSLKKAARRTELFAFNTSLVRLTPWVTPSKIAATLDRMAAGVPGWSGGTQIGECLAAFVERYLDEMVGASTVVVIVSDGLDRGDTGRSPPRCGRSTPGPAGSSGSIRCSATRATSPRPGGWRRRCRTSTCSRPAHNLESLEKLVPRLSAA